MIEEGQATGELGVTCTVQIDAHLNPGFQSVALDRCDAFRHANPAGCDEVGEMAAILQKTMWVPTQNCSHRRAVLPCIKDSCLLYTSRCV